MRADISVRAFTAISRRSCNPSQLPWTCQVCRHQLRQPSFPITLFRRRVTTKARSSTSTLTPGLQGLLDDDTVSKTVTVAIPKERPLTHAEKRAIQRLDILLEDSQAILQKDVVPTEEQILEALKTCHGLAEYFRAIKDKPALTTVKPGGEAGNLLFLEDGAYNGSTKQDFSPTVIGSMASSIADNAMDMIAAAVNKIAKDKKVFMTPTVLQQVVSILCSLGRPESLAEVFILYSEKPIPVPGSRPIKYNPSNPNKVAAAVPLDVAQMALDAGIKAQNLPLCLDITEYTVRTKAFRRGKFARKALLPSVLAAMTPFAAYVVATRLAEFQDSMPTATMTVAGTAGIMTYMGVIGTMGFITITTANDQMERVTWAPGTHMRQRWIREEERAFLDKIACAWGFSDRHRRGEEEGPEWEGLKELCGIRGMILDRVELMDGMQ